MKKHAPVVFICVMLIAVSGCGKAIDKAPIFSESPTPTHSTAMPLQTQEYLDVLLENSKTTKKQASEENAQSRFTISYFNPVS